MSDDICITTKLDVVPSDEFNDAAPVTVEISFNEDDTTGIVQVGDMYFYADSFVKVAKIIQRNTTP